MCNVLCSLLIKMPLDLVLVTQTVGAVLEVSIEVATHQGEH